MFKIKELNFRKQTVSHNCENDQNEGYKLIVRFDLNDYDTRPCESNIA